MQERAFIPHGMPGGVCACAPTDVLGGADSIINYQLSMITAGGGIINNYQLSMVTGAPVGAYRIRPRSYPAAGWGVRRRWRRLKGVCDTPLPGMRGGIINNYQLWGEARHGVSDPRKLKSEPHFGVSDTRKLKSEPHFGLSDTRRRNPSLISGLPTPGGSNPSLISGFPTPGSPAATLIWGYPNCSGV